MFKNCKQAISYIEGKRAKRTFLQFQETIKKHNIPVILPFTIHVAGTNGKGSTVQYIKEILMIHGYRVGTFTSPYMISHNDRICINGKPISDEDLLSYINRLVPIIEEEGLSMFEIDVLIMLLYFTSQPLDFCIIETGIGGKTDKTNVINSNISVITNVSYDHQELLGDTLIDIASQKAGIIKEHQLCFTTEKQLPILSIINQVCIHRNTLLKRITIEKGNTFTYKKNTYKVTNAASYAGYNAKLAVAVVDACIPMEVHKTKQAISRFNYPGRFEKIGRIYLDGAHNVAAMQELLESIKNLKEENIGIVFSALQDKDISNMTKVLSVYPILYASFEDSRSTMKGAIDYKIQITNALQKYQIVVVTGSLHFISEVRKYIIDTIS